MQIQKKKSLPTPPRLKKKPHEQKRKQRLEIKQNQKQTNKTTKKKRNKKNPINYKLLLI